MNYRETEDVCVDVPEMQKLMPVSEVLAETRKELSETLGVLQLIRSSLEGNCTERTKEEEPKCMYDDVLNIRRMALDCMGLTHAIYDKLFGLSNADLR